MSDLSIQDRIRGHEGIASVVRATSAERVNEIFNHPAVLPSCEETKFASLDLTAAVADRRNFILLGEHGCLGFMHQQPGIYEVHTAVLPSGLGRWRRDFCEAGLRFMFTRTDAFEIMTRVPVEHKAAMRAAEDVGMRREFVMPRNCVFRGEIMDVQILAFRIQDWFYGAPGMNELGAWLHERFFEEAVRLGMPTDHRHEDVPDHNRVAGAAGYMAFGGQPLKAVSLYNRRIAIGRVRHAGGKAALIQLVSLNPVTIRFDLGLLRFGETDVEVVPE